MCPSVIEPGTCVSSCIRVKGFRNIIHWRVTRYDEPRLIELRGAGRGGVRISLTIRGARTSARVEVHVVAELTGGLLSTAVGRLVARVLRVRGPQVGDQPRRAALTPFVVHGAGFVARLDGFDTAGPHP